MQSINHENKIELIIIGIFQANEHIIHYKIPLSANIKLKNKPWYRYISRFVNKWQGGPDCYDALGNKTEAFFQHNATLKVGQWFQKGAIYTAISPTVPIQNKTVTEEEISQEGFLCKNSLTINELKSQLGFQGKTLSMIPNSKWCCKGYW